MLIVLLRHGQTAYNEQRRYQGAARCAALASGKSRARERPILSRKPSMSPRCAERRRRRRILFPAVRGRSVVPALREMDFGVFEGRTYDEMKDDPAYRAWLDSGCESACPNGESKAVFCKRVCRAFAAAGGRGAGARGERLVIVAHGGTQMAALSRFAEPHRDYYSWNAPPAGGFRVGCADEWRAAAGAARGEDRWLCGGTDMNILYAMLGGFALDWLFGDPAWLTHPVVIMGKAISRAGTRLCARACRKRQAANGWAD